MCTACNKLIHIDMFIDATSENQISAYADLLRAIGSDCQEAEPVENTESPAPAQEPAQKRKYTRRNKVEEPEAPAPAPAPRPAAPAPAWSIGAN